MLCFCHGHSLEDLPVWHVPSFHEIDIKQLTEYDCRMMNHLCVIMKLNYTQHMIHPILVIIFSHPPWNLSIYILLGVVFLPWTFSRGLASLTCQHRGVRIQTLHDLVNKIQSIWATQQPNTHTLAGGLLGAAARISWMWTSNCIYIKTQDLITHPCTNFNKSLAQRFVEFKVWMNNYIPHKENRCDYLSMS